MAKRSPISAVVSNPTRDAMGQHLACSTNFYSRIAKSCMFVKSPVTLDNRYFYDLVFKDVRDIVLGLLSNYLLNKYIVYLYVSLIN